jgi:hypothetical protein
MGQLSGWWRRRWVIEGRRWGGMYTSFWEVGGMVEVAVVAGVVIRAMPSRERWRWRPRRSPGFQMAGNVLERIEDHS